MKPMHEMDSTNKIMSIIGLILDGLGLLSLVTGSIILLAVFTEDFFLRFDPTIPIDELSLILDMYQIMGMVMLVIAAVKVVFVVVNLIVFTRLIRTKYDEETAMKTYNYMFIYGILNIFMNTVSGILFIIAGYQGKSGHREVRQVREGI
jgi:hypothetical protein